MTHARLMDPLREGMCYADDGRRGRGVCGDLTPPRRIGLTKMEDSRERVTAG